MGEIDYDVGNPAKDYVTPDEQIKEVGLDPNKVKDDNYLDGPKVRRRFRQILEWWDQVRSLQTKDRQERLRDHDYYDGDQWDAEDKEAVEDRGQRACVYNLVKPTIDWLTGTEKRTRVDFRVLPRERDDSKGAETKTEVLKYVADINKSHFHRSRAFEDCAISGVGWIEAGIKSDETDEPLFVRYEDWRNIWYDPLSVERDLSDARYLFRAKYVDIDIAAAMFPDRAGQIRAASISEDTYYEEYDTELDDTDPERAIMDAAESGEDVHPFNRRSRVRLVECWYRQPGKVKILRGKELGTVDGTVYDQQDPFMVGLVESGVASVYDAIRMVVRQMIFCGKYVLQDQPSPYKHQRFPFIPIWGQRKKKDGAPYGAVRQLRDPQDDLNKRRSKALFILSSNRVVADDNATDDWDNLYDEAQRPDGVIRKKSGTEVRLENDFRIGAEHIKLMEQDKQYIESTGGVTDENMGRETNATSGKAILARQEQGHVINQNLFDNLRYAIQLAGEIELSLIEQYYTEPKVIRIVGDRGQLEWMQINAQTEDGLVENDITARQADYLVDTQAYNATLRQQMFETFGELLTKLPPEVAVNLLDLWVDLSDLPGKDEMVKRIRSINGQPDPDEDLDDPEVVARRQAQEEAKAYQAELAQKLQELAIEEKDVENRKTKAEIKEILAKVDEIVNKIHVENEKVDLESQKVTIEKAKAVNEFERGEKEDERADAEAKEKPSDKKPAKK